MLVVGQVFFVFLVSIFSFSASASTRDMPNILLLMLEDLSPRLGAFGDSVAVTPNIDKLASEGVRYTRVFATAGVCAPSRASIITGMHQISMGGQHMRASTRGYFSVPPPEVKAFPEVMRSRGYFTFNLDKLDYQFSEAVPGSGPFTIWDIDRLQAPVEKGVDIDSIWDNVPAGSPFFGYMNFWYTHESQIFPSLREDALPVEERTQPDEIQLEPYYPDTPTVRKDIARHYDNIRRQDKQIGDVLAKLEADGLAANTIVILTTDHGDGLPRGKRELYDSGLKVPMIIRWPERYRPEELSPGQVDARLISFVDLAPTILGMAGIEAPDYMQGRDILDRSQLPRQYIYASRDRMGEVSDRQRAVRDERFKLIVSYEPEREGGYPSAFRDNIEMMREMHALREAGKLNEDQMQWFLPPGEQRLFDLARDPYELHDVSNKPGYAKDVIRMKAALNAWLERVDDWSDEPETVMVNRFQPHGERQVTAEPRLEFFDGKVVIKPVTENSSLGYRVNDGAWQLYTGPITVTNRSTVEAKAVRYGWKESAIVSLNID